MAVTNLAYSVFLMGASGGEGPGIISTLLPLVLIIAIFYFFIIRPQRKREQEKQDMIDAIEKGDRIVTVGGLHGEVKSVDEDSVLAQIDKQVKVRIQKQAISQVPSKEDG